MQLIELINEYEKTLNFKDIQNLRVYNNKKTDILTFFKASTDINKITSKKCNSYIEHLFNKGNSVQTIRAKYSLIKSYLTYALRNDYIKTIPYVKLPKIQDKEKTTIDKKTILKILKWCKLNNELELRQAILIGYYTGARISNILTIKPKQIDEGYLRLWHNKTNTPYSIPIKQRLKVILNKKFKPFKLNYQRAYYLFNIIKKELNLDSTITIHSLRHTFCSRCIEKGIDLRLTQALAGHKSISTTIRYTHIKNKQLENAINLI